MTLGNTDGEIGCLTTISDPPTQSGVEALRDKVEELADDVRALSTLIHALRGALVAVGVVKGGGRSPGAGGTFAFRRANRAGAGATGPTLKKGSWMKTSVLA